MNETPARDRKILFLAVGPEEMTRLNLEREVREVQTALERGTQRGLTLVSATAVKISDLQHVLDREAPDIVHFGGHGSDAREQLVFLDEADHALPVDVEALADVMRGHQGVVLNACSSARQAEAIAARGAWAVGMAGRFETRAAIIFSRTFYLKLADGKTEKEAFDGAVLQLRIEGKAEAAGLPRFFAGPVPTDPTSQAPVEPIPAAGPRPTTLAFAEVGYDDPTIPMLVAACVVSDRSDALEREIKDWRDRLLRDPMVPESVKQRAHKADLTAMVDEPALRPRLLGWLSTTSFSAYVYFGRGPALATLPAAKRRRRVLVEPLVHRMRKKAEVITRAAGVRADLNVCCREAAAVVAGEPSGHAVPPPAVAKPGRSPLVELAQLIAVATSRHLAAPTDEDDAILFNHLRSRVRFAMNLETRERHTRDKNPLP